MSAGTIDRVESQELRISRGTLADYLALAPHHYRAGRPATIARENATARSIAACSIALAWAWTIGHSSLVGRTCRRRS